MSWRRWVVLRLLSVIWTLKSLLFDLNSSRNFLKSFIINSFAFIASSCWTIDSLFTSKDCSRSCLVCWYVSIWAWVCWRSFCNCICFCSPSLFLCRVCSCSSLRSERVFFVRCRVETLYSNFSLSAATCTFNFVISSCKLSIWSSRFLESSCNCVSKASFSLFFDTFTSLSFCNLDASSEASSSADEISSCSIWRNSTRWWVSPNSFVNCVMSLSREKCLISLWCIRSSILSLSSLRWDMRSLNCCFLFCNCSSTGVSWESFAFNSLISLFLRKILDGAPFCRPPVIIPAGSMISPSVVTKVYLFPLVFQILRAVLKLSTNKTSPNK